MLLTLIACGMVILPGPSALTSFFPFPGRSGLSVLDFHVLSPSTPPPPAPFPFPSSNLASSPTATAQVRAFVP